MSTAATPQPTLSPDYASGPLKATRVRWGICALLFFATTINYIDRSILSALAPILAGADAIHWRPYQFGLINAGFTIAYGIGFLVMGNLIDRVGTRIGYAISLVIWTLSAIATAFTNTPGQFGLARFCLGLGEAGNYPAAIKTVAEWFPQNQRATATGFVNAGSNMGALLAPIVGLVIVPIFGWRAAFLITPVFAIVWLVLWLKNYRTPGEHPRVNEAERQLIGIESAKPKKVRWRNILPHRQAWSFMVAKFITDPVWWFFLFWSGTFFYDHFGVKLAGVAFPLILVYVMADVGAIAGGWLSSTLIKRGWTPNRARKTAMCLSACFIVPVVLAPMIPASMPGGLWLAAALIGSAMGGHQGFSSNLFTTTSDMFPRRAVSSVNGIGGVSQSIGITIVQAIAGVIVEITKDYFTLFLFASLAYPIAILMVHLLVPRLTPVTEETLESKPMPRGVTAFVFAVLGFIVAVPLSFVFQVAAHNNTQYYVVDKSSLMTQAFTDKSSALPKDLLKSADLKIPDKDPISVKIVTKRDPTPAEAAQIADLQTFADDTYEKSKAQVKPGFTFIEYMASALPPGTIYHSIDRAQVLPPLIWSPLGGLAIGALAGALLHGVIFKRKPANAA